MRVHVSSRLPAVRVGRTCDAQNMFDHMSDAVASQNAFGLGYEAEYNGRACVVQTVVEDFARRFSLPAKMCTAFQVGKKLDGNELLLQVDLLVFVAANHQKRSMHLPDRPLIASCLSRC